MSLKLLIDEDSQAKRLVNLLQSAGHDVKTVAACNTNHSGLQSRRFSDEIKGLTRSIPSWLL